MRQLLWALLVLCLVASPGQAKDPIEWRPAIVLHAEYRLDHPLGLAGLGGTTVARGEFDFDAGDVIYTAEEHVAPNVRMQLSPGDTVQFAIDKKTFMLKLNSKKVRKLKLVSSIDKGKK